MIYRYNVQTSRIIQDEPVQEAEEFIATRHEFVRMSKRVPRFKALCIQRIVASLVEAENYLPCQKLFLKYTVHDVVTCHVSDSLNFDFN